MKNKRFYGWKKDQLDLRDVKYSVSAPIELPKNIDLRSQCPPVYDQKQINSCVGNSVTFDVQFVSLKQAETYYKDVAPSRLFTYYNARLIDGGIIQDEGSTIRSGIKSINTYGSCLDSFWPYNVDKVNNKPIKKSYTEAKKHKSISYSSINQVLVTLKTCLASGYPFVCGISVYEGFESEDAAKTGIIPMPSSNDKPLGGHAVSFVGFDEGNQWFIGRNSWGDSWGDKGYFYLKYDYILNPALASDFWTIQKIM